MNRSNEEKENAIKRFSIFFCGCKQFKSFHTYSVGAKVIIKQADSLE